MCSSASGPLRSMSTSTDCLASRSAASDHEDGDEQRGDGVRPLLAGRHEHEADEHRERARQVGREVQRVRRQRPASGSAATRGG